MNQDNYPRTYQVAGATVLDTTKLSNFAKAIRRAGVSRYEEISPAWVTLFGEHNVGCWWLGNYFELVKPVPMNGADALELEAARGR